MTALGTHLLLVDDDVKLCRLIGQYLEPLGYKVSVAHTSGRFAPSRMCRF
jgi:DNA-binding response OmpR family regulator